MINVDTVNDNLRLFARKALGAVRASSIDQFKASQGNQYLESIVEPGLQQRLLHSMRSLASEDRTVASAMTFIRLLPISHSADKRAKADGPEANPKWILKKRLYEAMVQPVQRFLGQVSKLNPGRSIQKLYSELIKQSSNLKDFVGQHQELIDSVKEVLSHKEVGKYLSELVANCAESIKEFSK